MWEAKRGTRLAWRTPLGRSIDNLGVSQYNLTFASPSVDTTSRLRAVKDDMKLFFVLEVVKFHSDSCLLALAQNALDT